MSKMISIVSNANIQSKQTGKQLKEIFESYGYQADFGYYKEAELVVCIGGDGAFLKALHKYNFPCQNFVGINTGHLGFFQEIHPDGLEDFVKRYADGKYTVDKLQLVSAEVYTNKRSFSINALNEVVLKANHSKIIHIDVFINRNHVQKFSGDGILICSASGSTAYNFSGGGSILHPDLDSLQMTPLCPVNSVAYRSLPTSIIVPGDFTISLVPEKRYANSNLVLVDGREIFVKDLHRINFRSQGKYVSHLSFSRKSYWDNIKSKFL
ncbi:NAD(+)/NADH kinase [Peptoniphilus sp. GNH]|nr:NAD(+)/NADH kinase [Clostridiales bacterium KA00134]UHR02828.1 NAD(+)/NADH kinase [Peptoniphilus sp. GNH]